MGTPTKAELREALGEAVRMREHDEDEHFLAKCLLSHNYRMGLLLHVLDAARHYLHSGLAPHEHSELVKAIATAEKAGIPAGRAHEDFGLE